MYRVVPCFCSKASASLLKHFRATICKALMRASLSSIRRLTDAAVGPLPVNTTQMLPCLGKTKSGMRRVAIESKADEDALHL